MPSCNDNTKRPAAQNPDSLKPPTQLVWEVFLIGSSPLTGTNQPTTDGRHLVTPIQENKQTNKNNTSDWHDSRNQFSSLFFIPANGKQFLVVLILYIPSGVGRAYIYTLGK